MSGVVLSFHRSVQSKLVHYCLVAIPFSEAAEMLNLDVNILNIVVLKLLFDQYGTN